MNIMIIDDHRLFAEGLELLIDELGSELDVSIYESCDKALAHDIKRPPDLIILDYYLAEIDGRATVQMVNKTFPFANIVVVSSEESPQIIHETIRNGAIGFIPKSSSKIELMLALRLVLSGAIYLPQQAISKFLGQAGPKKALPLSERQIEVVRLAVTGLQNKLIADRLNIAEGTVKAHLHLAYRALGVTNRTQAVYKLAELDLDRTES